MLHELSYGAMLKWIRQPESHRSRVITNDVRRSLRLGGIENGRASR